MTYLMPRIMGVSPSVRKKAAFAFAKLDAAVSSLDDSQAELDFASFDPQKVVVQCHFMRNNLFMTEGYILANADKIKTPTVIVQGRYDCMCPPFTAYELSQKLPNCQLVWTIAGHSGVDRGNFEAIRTALGS
jgi:proline iminopeptidase